MNIMKRSLFIGGLAALAMATYAGPEHAAGATTWRLSSQIPPDSIEGKAYDLFAQAAAKHSNGRIEVKVFPNEQLGKWDAVTEQLSRNVIQVAPTTAAFLSKWAPGIKYISAPFVFKDYDHWARFMETELVKGWLAEVESKSNLMVLGRITDFPRGSYRTLVTKSPVRSVDDIKGMKLRMFNDKLAIGVWAHLGADVRVLSWSDVYDGLNRGIVDAVTSPAELVEPNKLYEVAPNVTRTDEYPQGVAFITSATAYKALSAEDKAAVLKAQQEAAAFARKEIDAASEGFVALMKEKKVVVSSALDIGPIVQKTAEFYKVQAKEGELPAGFMEAVAATAKP